jgi:hypothetical protein
MNAQGNKFIMASPATHTTTALDPVTNEAAKALASVAGISLAKWLDGALEKYPDRHRAKAVGMVVAESVPILLANYCGYEP